MKKYFQVQDYYGNMKARVAIFNLNGRESIGDSISSSHRNKRKSRYQNSSYGEFKKEKPPTFDGEVKSNQEAKA